MRAYNKSTLRPLEAWMEERQRIYERRVVEQRAPPWTRDEIMQRYRFCNVYRELDTVTRWIDEHIRRPFATHENLWFMLCIARQINLPDTLAALLQSRGWPRGPRWYAAAFERTLVERFARKLRVYTGSYMLSGPSDGARTMPAMTTRIILAPIWARRRELVPRLRGTMQAATVALSETRFWGGRFIAYEVVCDLRHTRYLDNAPDVNTWTNVGPGSRRGYNRLLGRPLAQRVQDNAFIDFVTFAHETLYPRWHTRASAPFELREIEHSMCEFDKYERVRLGEGRPRQLFKGV